jgi:ABC-type transporter Mla subunit MlaD
MQEVAQHLTDLARLTSALFAGYIFKAWPFFFAHIFVAFLIRNSWRELNREREALKEWRIGAVQGASTAAIESNEAKDTEMPTSVPQVLDPTKRQTIVVLDQFVTESRVLGAKGFFVPMTDFSDRLDSAVEGKIAELHDRTNLFLFVGIAGTMFGVFEFAFNSYRTIVSEDIQQSQKLIDLAKYLSGSMAKAFPVGFFGLLFTFVAQVISSRPEHRLREALSNATRRALEFRETATHSHAALMLEAADSIQVAMRPLKDLRDTLSESLKPVVEVFGTRLDISLKRVEETSAGIKTAVTSVVQAVHSVAGASKNLERLISETPVVIDRLIELEQAHETALRKLEGHFDSVFERANKLSQSLEQTVTNLGSLSEQVVRESSEGIKRVEAAAVSAWNNSSEVLRQKLEKDLEAVFGDMKMQMAALTSGVAEALTTMNSLAREASESLEAIKVIAPQISGSYAKSIQEVGLQTITEWNVITSELGANSQKAYLEHLGRVEGGTLNSAKSLNDAASAWHRLASNSEHVLREPVEAAVKEARRDLVESLRALDTSAEIRLKQTSEDLENLHRSISELVSKVSLINSSLEDWAKTARPVTDNIKTATDSLRPITQELSRQTQSQQQIVTELMNAADKLERLTRRTGRPPIENPPPSSPTPSLRSRRVWWKPSTWFKRVSQH